MYLHLFTYYVFKKSILYSELLNELGQDFLDIHLVYITHPPPKKNIINNVVDCTENVCSFNLVSKLSFYKIHFMHQKNKKYLNVTYNTHNSRFFVSCA